MGSLGFPPQSRAVDFFWCIWGPNGTTWWRKSFAGILFKVKCNNAVDIKCAVKGFQLTFRSALQFFERTLILKIAKMHFGKCMYIYIHAFPEEHSCIFQDQTAFNSQNVLSNGLQCRLQKCVHFNSCECTLTLQNVRMQFGKCTAEIFYQGPAMQIVEVHFNFCECTLTFKMQECTSGNAQLKCVMQIVEDFDFCECYSNFKSSLIFESQLVQTKLYGSKLWYWKMILVIIPMDLKFLYTPIL